MNSRSLQTDVFFFLEKVCNMTVGNSRFKVLHDYFWLIQKLWSISSYYWQTNRSSAIALWTSINMSSSFWKQSRSPTEYHLKLGKYLHQSHSNDLYFKTNMWIILVVNVGHELYLPLTLRYVFYDWRSLPKRNESTQAA